MRHSCLIKGVITGSMKKKNIDMIKGFAMVLSAGVILGCVTAVVWMGGEAFQAGSRKEAVSQNVTAVSAGEAKGETAGSEALEPGKEETAYGSGDAAGREDGRTESGETKEENAEGAVAVVKEEGGQPVGKAGEPESDQSVGKSGEPESDQPGGKSGESGESNRSGKETDELEFAIAGGEEARAGIPEKVLAQIEDINSGKPLDEAIGSEALKDYYALVATYDIIARNPDSREEATGRGSLTLYIPNLLKGLSDVSALFYDKAEGEWRIVPAEKVNTDAKTVTVTLTGSGTMTVIYRRK